MVMKLLTIIITLNFINVRGSTPLYDGLVATPQGALSISHSTPSSLQPTTTKRRRIAGRRIPPPKIIPANPWRFCVSPRHTPHAHTSPNKPSQIFRAARSIQTTLEIGQNNFEADVVSQSIPPTPSAIYDISVMSPLGPSCVSAASLSRGRILVGCWR